MVGPGRREGRPPMASGLCESGISFNVDTHTRARADSSVPPGNAFTLSISHGGDPLGSAAASYFDSGPNREGAKLDSRPSARSNSLGRSDSFVRMKN
jgi:hypothetical protein